MSAYSQKRTFSQQENRGASDVQSMRTSGKGALMRPLRIWFSISFSIRGHSLLQKEFFLQSCRFKRSRQEKAIVCKQLYPWLFPGRDREADILAARKPRRERRSINADFWERGFDASSTHLVLNFIFHKRSFPAPKRVFLAIVPLQEIAPGKSHCV